jgi:hypothetical protein
MSGICRVCVDGIPMAVAIAAWNLVPQQLSCRVDVVSEGQLGAATYHPSLDSIPFQTDPEKGHADVA